MGKTTDVAAFFPGQAATIRLFGAILLEQNDELGRAARRKRGKTPGRLGTNADRSLLALRKVQQFRGDRSAIGPMLHLRARSFAPLTARPAMTLETTAVLSDDPIGQSARHGT